MVRLNQQSSHLASRSAPKGALKGQKACDMCCRVCSTKDGELIANVAPHKRKGFPGFVSCSICNVVLCTKPRMQHHGLTNTCFELYHTTTTDELSQLHGVTCKLTHEEKMQRGFVLVQKENLCATTKKKQLQALAMTARRQQVQEVRTRDVVVVDVTPTDGQKKKNQQKDVSSKNTTKKRKRKKAAKSLAFGSSQHQSCDDVYVVCEFLGCAAKATYGYSGNTRYCEEHRLEGMSEVL